MFVKTLKTKITLQNISKLANFLAALSAIFAFGVYIKEGSDRKLNSDALKAQLFFHCIEFEQRRITPSIGEAVTGNEPGGKGFTGILPNTDLELLDIEAIGAVSSLTHACETHFSSAYQLRAE